MKTATQTILERLDSLEFETQLGEFAPFEERVPLVSGVAWEAKTAQLALIAEDDGELDPSAWKQLIFAASGLRHHLGGTGSAAFGAPIVIGIVSAEGVRSLRCLVEEVAHDYVVFNRVDLNLVLRDDVDDREKLDQALAPLLPRCRESLGEEISREEVQRFWRMLRDEIDDAAAKLDEVFGDRRAMAGREGGDSLIGDLASQVELPSPEPVREVSIKGFRSMKQVDPRFADVNIVHGPNGGGKTTLLEALEMLWAGVSQRKPATTKAEEYERHLRRRGEDDFEIVGDDRPPVTEVAPKPRAELGRCVLTQDAIGALVGSSPDDRYDAFLAATGLEIPDLNERSAALVERAKDAADAALGEAGLPRLPRRDSRGLGHVESSLERGFAERLPTLEELTGLEESLASASGDAYRMRSWPAQKEAFEALFRLDGMLKGFLKDIPSDKSLAAVFDAAVEQLDPLIASRLEAAECFRHLLEAIGEREPGIGAPVPPLKAAKAPPIPEELAARWLGHSRTVSASARRFREDAAELSDSYWAERLRKYADAADQLAAEAPQKELEKFTTPRRRAEPPVDRAISAEVFDAAGFSTPPSDSEAIVAPLRELVRLFGEQAADLEALKGELAEHPAHTLREHAGAVLDALCRFELARSLRRAGPILRASEKLVRELLGSRLIPIARELVASAVRFEWYFQPLLVPEAGRKIVLGGLATPRDDLDARLLLNSAERTTLGLAWFLALHMLQPADRRRVLVLDDPTSGFDVSNQAGFVSTLRTFVRLVRPEQLFVATHDDTFAVSLSEELGSVDGWPATVARLRCQRDPDDCSRITVVREDASSRSVALSSRDLGLHEAPTASSSH